MASSWSTRSTAKVSLVPLLEQPVLAGRFQLLHHTNHHLRQFGL